MKLNNGETNVGVQYTIDDDHVVYMKTVAKFDQFKLEELQKEFSELFKLTGNLYAFGDK